MAVSLPKFTCGTNTDSYMLIVLIFFSLNTSRYQSSTFSVSPWHCTWHNKMQKTENFHKGFKL